MTSSRLTSVAADLRAKAKAATEGPWKNEPDTMAGRVWVQIGRHGADLAPVTLPPYDIAMKRGDIARERMFEVRRSERYQETREANYAQRVADAAYIAAMHPAVGSAAAHLLEVIAADVGTSSLAFHAALALCDAYEGSVDMRAKGES